MSAESAACIAVGPQAAARRYDRMIFGHFLEHFHRQVYGGVFDPGSDLSDENGFRTDVIEALRHLCVPVVRWPGGCFVSAYHWRDGVGPERQPTYDKAWYVEESNAFGTDEFVAWCRLIGAEPYICTNAGTGPPEEMSDWVEYCNLESMGKWAGLRRANGYAAPHNVKYWSIGNENYGSWEIGAKTVGEWGPLVAESAKMMRHVDPGIRLLAAALADEEWTTELLRHAGEYLDYVSLHGYWDALHEIDRPSDYGTCVCRSLEPEADILKTRRIIAEAGFEGRIAIAFDEWNLRGWHHPSIGKATHADVAARDRNDENSTYTMADAVFSAGFLNSCLRHSDIVGMANIAPVINTRGPLFVHPDGIVKRTTYHVMSMYANLLQPNVVETQVESPPFQHAGVSIPAVDAVATCDESKTRWSLAVVNRDPERPLRCRISLGASTPPSGFRGQVLSGADPDACNDVSCPDRVLPVDTELTVDDGCITLPPHSVSILEPRSR